MVNRVVLLGNLGRDPELKPIGDGQSVTRLSVATHETIRKRTGERERKTEWHEVVAWGALGDRAAKHLRKGRSVLVEGRLQTRLWSDFRGNKHITAEVRADRILFLGGGNTERGLGGHAPSAANEAPAREERRPSEDLRPGAHAEPAS